MHELSLCRAIADTVRDHADGRDVTRVAIRIGHLRQVVPATLSFCWDLVVEGSDLAGARLEIEHVPAVLACAACASTARLERPVLRCGSCHSDDVELLSGEEFVVASIDVQEVL